MTCCTITITHKAGISTYAVDVDVWLDGRDGVGTVTGGVRLRNGEPHGRRLTKDEITDALDSDETHAIAAEAIEVAREQQRATARTRS